MLGTFVFDNSKQTWLIPREVCVCVCGGGGGGGGGVCMGEGGGVGAEGRGSVIVARVFEQVFRNLPHSYTWPFKKKKKKKKTDPFIYEIVWNVDPFIYCPLIFYPFIAVDKNSNQFIEYQENKQPRKISEGKICAYTGIHQKNGTFHRPIHKKWGQSYTFWLKRGLIIYLAALKIRHSARTTILCHI